MDLTLICDCPIPEPGEETVYVTYCPRHGEEALRKKKGKKAHLAEMAEQDKVWKERRMVSGHGAQDGSARDPNYKSLIVFLGGPIKHWWDENWMTPPHIRYDDWRTQVEEACIAAGFLIYKPFTAWKGTWNEQAQQVNNAVIEIVDVFIDLTPPGVPSEGTEAERALAEAIGTRVMEVPPPDPAKDEWTLEVMVGGLEYHADVKNGKIDV